MTSNRYAPRRLVSVGDIEPRVSILLAVRDEAAVLDSLLRVLERQTYPSALMEVIVAVAPSSDSTEQIVSRFAERNPSCRVLSNRAHTHSEGLRMGLQASQGDVIIWLSGHAMVADTYVASAIEELRRTGAGIVGGRARPVGEGLWGEAIALAHELPFGLGGADFRRADTEGWTDTAYLGAYWRRVIDEVGAWDARLIRNQDIELNARVRGAGYGIFISPALAADYRTRSTVAGVWRQNFANGLWWATTIRTSADSLSLRHMVPLIFVLSVIAGACCWLLGTLVSSEALALVGYSTLAAVFAAYLLSCALVVALAARRTGLPIAIRLPLVFAAMHFAYGLGSLRGLFGAQNLGQNR